MTPPALLTPCSWPARHPAAGTEPTEPFQAALGAAFVSATAWPGWRLLALHGVRGARWTSRGYLSRALRRIPQRTG